MPPAPLPSASPRRHFWIALGLCLTVCLLALLVWSQTEDPWKGRTASLIFGKDRGELSASTKYSKTFRFFLDRTLPERERAKPDDWIKLGWWVGSLVTVCLSAAAAASVRWWLPRCQRAPAAGPVPSGWSAPNWSRGVLIFALLLAGAVRIPPLGSAILWDEQDNLRRNFHGYYDYQKPGAPPIWQEATLADSLWENARGNNPHIFSFLSHASNSAWRVLTGAERERFSMVATRLPSAVFGIGSIVSLWWLMNLVGLQRFAPWAALLAAAHPLSAEFSIQARAYGLTLFLTPLILGFGWRALKLGRWRDFTGFGICNFLCLGSFPGSLYFVAAINVLMACLLLRQWRRGAPETVANFWRWLVINAASGILFLWFIAPAVPQMATYMNNAFQKGIMPPFWYVVSYHMFSTGMHFEFPLDPYFKTDGSAPSAIVWLCSDFWRAWPVALWSLVVFPLLTLRGLCVWYQSADREFTLLALATLLAGVLCIAHHAIFTHCYIYAWYAVYWLPVLLAATATGAASLMRPVAGQAESRARALPATAIGPCVCALWLLAISHPAVQQEGWKTAGVRIHARPIASAWPAPDGLIGRKMHERGHGLWVIYADGCQVLFQNHEANKAAWQPLMDRPISQWGKGITLPPSPVIGN